MRAAYRFYPHIRKGKGWPDRPLVMTANMAIRHLMKEYPQLAGEMALEIVEFNMAQGKRTLDELSNIEAFVEDAGESG